jgi:hypothetical protein
MKNLEDKIIFAFYGVFGAAIGFLIFVMALGGWRFVFTGHYTRLWNGPVALLVCLAVGLGFGLFSYKFRNREFGSGTSSLYEDQATAILFAKRLLVIATCLAGLYYIWQLAKDL